MRWETLEPKARNESLDIRVYALAALRSCVGNNGEKFWDYQAKAIGDEYEVKINKKKPPKKGKIPVQRQQEIWN